MQQQQQRSGGRQIEHQAQVHATHHSAQVHQNPPMVGQQLTPQQQHSLKQQQQLKQQQEMVQQQQQNFPPRQQRTSSEFKQELVSAWTEHQAMTTSQQQQHIQQQVQQHQQHLSSSAQSLAQSAGAASGAVAESVSSHSRRHSTQAQTSLSSSVYSGLSTDVSLPPHLMGSAGSVAPPTASSSHFSFRSRNASECSSIPNDVTDLMSEFEDDPVDPNLPSFTQVSELLQSSQQAAAASFNNIDASAHNFVESSANSIASVAQPSVKHPKTKHRYH